MTLERHQELRKVPEAYLDPITVILDINEDWKRVMAIIPKDLQSDRFIPKYNCEHVRLIEQHAKTTNTRCAKVLFDEWGTSGRVRPTVQTLMGILQKAQIIRAAEELAALLHEELPSRPTVGPGAPIDTNVSLLLNNASALQTPQANGTNGTFGSLHARPTRPMTSGLCSQEIPDFEALGHLSTAQLQSAGMNQSTFRQPMPSAEYLPNFSVLMPRTGPIDYNTNSTISAASTSNSETSSASEDINQSHSETPYSHFQIPSTSLIDRVDSEILEDKTLIDFKYSELEAITRKFSDSHIGSGGFGDVFVGTHEKYGVLAIKRAHIMLMNIPTIDFVKIFNTEVKSLMILRHENIVPILGYSLDGVAPCIVCKYIEGGSLLENIAEKRLNETHIMNITLGTAEGLKYIHNTVKSVSLTSTISSTKKAYFLHGDVKSANILITKDFVPKLCDFGLSRECITTNHQTETMMGTRAYMAPERFHGTITQKGDVFSFGIVMLELLTGQQSIIEDSNGKVNIKEYVEENGIGDDIKHLLDPVIEDKARGQKLYEVAQLCFITDKKERPTINVICDHLYNIINK